MSGKRTGRPPSSPPQVALGGTMAPLSLRRCIVLNAAATKRFAKSAADSYRFLNMIIDIESSDQLLGYLRATERIGSQEKPVVRTLKGGVSNKTVWLQPEHGPAWVVKQALAKLRVKTDWFSDPLRIGIESDPLRFLPRITPPAPITPPTFHYRYHN